VIEFDPVYQYCDGYFRLSDLFDFSGLAELLSSWFVFILKRVGAFGIESRT